MSTTTTLLPFLIIFILSISVSVCSKCLHDQRSSLLQLRHDLSFEYDDSEVKLRTWNTSTDCCSWRGVTCNFKGHVIALDLSEEWLSGVVDDSSPLFGLRHMEHLNLGYNLFEGQKMPTKFINFVNLTYLNLSGVGFIGQIPLSITNLISLTTLDLSYNYYGNQTLEVLDLRKLVQNLTSLTELYLDGINLSSSKNNKWSRALSSSTPNLKVLSLQNCQLSGLIDSSLQNLRFLSDINLAFNNLSSPIPESLSNLPSLISLILTNSGLHGTFPKNIFQVPSLKILDLSFNYQLYGCLPEFYHNGSLQELYLPHTSFYGLIPSSIGNLQHLLSLDLSHNNFIGLLPSSISNLQHLQSLDLSHNNFTGLIPCSLGNLQHLQSLNLSHNNFIGLVPSSIAELKELTFIDLSFNNLSGPIPSLSSLKSLTQMSLSGNKFSGSISSTDWNELANLTSLNLRGNSFTGEIPSSLFGQSEEVDLSHNQFTGLPKEFPELLSSQLYMLDLSCNKIQGRLPSWIWEIKYLLYLNVSHNFLDEVGKASKDKWNLLTLDLHANRIQGQIQFVPSSSLKYIDYSNNNFSSIIPTTFFQHLNSLENLFFSNNNFEGSIPHSMCKEFLTILDFSNNSLNGTIPQCLFEGSLVALDLSSNNLTGPIPDKFANDFKVEYVDLSNNRLEGKIPRSMSNCKSLQFLNLEKNQLNDVFPIHLMKISALRVLGLQSNKLHGSIDCGTKNGSWPNLHVINIASNDFSGEIPENCLRSWVALMVVQNHSNPLGFRLVVPTFNAFQRISFVMYSTIIKGREMELSKVFREFTSIDFSSNNFQGKISKVFGELKGLRILNLSHNTLSGEIPAFIGRLKVLESLDFSRNNLSGAIPSELASMSFLEYADFSYNQLVGQIPTGTQLQSFPSSYFEGNPKLCGPPLKIICSKQNSRTGSELDGHLNSTRGIEWNFISIEVGFTFGLGVVILPITFSRRWRILFYRHVKRLLFKLLPRLDPRNYMSPKRQVGNLNNLRRQ